MVQERKKGTAGELSCSWWAGMGLSAMVLAGNTESSSLVTEKKAEYMGIEVGWWEDVVMVAWEKFLLIISIFTVEQEASGRSEYLSFEEEEGMK